VTHRLMVRGGRVRRVEFAFRLPTYPETRLWLSQVGFRSVGAHDEAGRPYSVRSNRMIVVARR
jgi:hypothetical protein